MGKHEKTLGAVFAEPTRANIAWRDVEAMLVHYGAELSEGRGSRIRATLHGIDAVFHRPHPQNETGKPMVESVRRFLTNAGVTP